MDNISDLSIEERLYFLEQREHIRELVCDYSVAVDDRDIETIADLFTEDGVFARDRLPAAGPVAQWRSFAKR